MAPTIQSIAKSSAKEAVKKEVKRIFEGNLYYGCNEIEIAARDKLRRQGQPCDTWHVRELIAETVYERWLGDEHSYVCLVDGRYAFGGEFHRVDDHVAGVYHDLDYWFGGYREKLEARWELITMEQRRDDGRCQHCGGRFKGFWTLKCRDCGKEKDYID